LAGTASPIASGGHHGLESSGGAKSTGGDASSLACVTLPGRAPDDFCGSLSPEPARCSGDQVCDADAPAGARCFGTCRWKDSQEWNALALMVCEDFYSQGCTDTDVRPILCVK